MTVADARAKGVVGGAGAVPPPDAPQESAQPLQPATVAVQQERAAANEKTLPPFKPPTHRQQLPPAAPVVPSKTEALIADVFGSETTRPMDRPTLVVPGQGLPVPAADPDQGLTDQMDDALPALTAEDRLRMPAASETDTPTKGLLPTLTPQTSGDKWDGISKGGFSDIGEAQYFPLAGNEAAELAFALADTLVDQVKNDLRFSMALTYPRIRMTLQLIVEGHAEDNNSGFVIEKTFAPKDGENGSTPLDVAKARADEVCFVVKALRQEFTPNGEIDRPPDAMRDELGLPKPGKRVLDTNVGQVFVDVIPGSDTRAVTR